MKTEIYTHDNGVQILKLTGRLAGAERRGIQQLLPTYIETSSKLIIDCSELEYVDSSGLGLLISGLKSAIYQGGDLRLASILTSVKMMLELTRADKLFKVYPTVTEALASFEITNINIEGI